MIAYTYDAMGNLVSQTTTGAYDLALEYAYDRSGRMTKESRTENGATLTSGYVYDALGQLTAFERSDNISESYTYDPVGNMLSKTQNGVKTRYTYNAANQLVSDGENRYAYDKNGNLTQKGNTKYTYNALNLLESWTDGEHSETYTYNANGLLSTIQNNEGTTNLTWDVLMGDGVVIAANTNGVETNYTYGLERISAQTGNRKTEYVYDGRGSVAAELSYNNAWYTLGGALSKKAVTSKSYTPFGEPIGEQVSGFGYNGEYYNAVTGMVYLRARFYEPEMNRFSQKDIIRGSVTDPTSLNRYAYVQNDPVNFIDPSGESLKSAWNSVKSWATNLFTGGSSKPAPAAPSKPPAASPSAVRTGAKPAGTAAAAVRGGTTGIVARGSTGGSAYTGSSSGAGRAQSLGPVQSTAPATRYVNANNVTQSTAQAVADARKAADYMNATAPGSPAAQQATRTYLETKRLAARANATHDPNIARQAVQASQASVNHTNNVATGRSPNAYSPYNSNGNATSYFNSSYQTGKTPSPGAPRIEELNEQLAYYCSIADRVPNINAFGAGDYGGIGDAISIFQNYRNGSQVSSLNNLGMAFVNIIGALESVRGDDKTPIATALYNRINKSIRELEANSNDNMAYNAGRVGKDIESLIFDLFLLKEVGSEKLLENSGLIAKAGEVIVSVGESAGALEAIAGLTAAGNAAWNGSNLGKDLNDLVQAIKNNQTPEGSTDSSKDFYEQTKNLPTNERVAAYKEKASEVAAENGWVKDSNMSKRSGHTVYRDTKTGEYYSLDTQHGTFEHISSRGKHIEEVDFELNIVSGADKTGQHDFNIR